MKKIIEFLKHFLEKNGVIKIIVAFAVLIISVLVLNGNLANGTNIFFTITGYISLIYIILVGLIYFIVGIVNSIKDIFKK